MPDATRPLQTTATGRVLDAQQSFGRARGEAGTIWGLVARSDAMLDVLHLVERLAPSSRSALVEGEAGAGKTLLMTAVHRAGPCRAVPPLVLAGRDPAGLARVHDAAAGSRAPLVCLVPELADVAGETQAALVGALRTAEALPLGVGLHAIAATSFDSTRLRGQGRVRDDLFFLLTAARYRMPTLAERAADLPELATSLVRDICRELGREPMAIAGAALDVLAARAWPGHGRELRNVITRAVALNDSGVLGAHTIRQACALDPEPAPVVRRLAPEARPIDPGITHRVTAALSATGGNKSEAAARLGMSRRSLYRLLERLDA